MKTFILRDAAIADRACAYIRSLVGGETVFAVMIADADKKRTLEQNDKLHKLIRDIADEAWVSGRQMDVKAWKRWLLIRLGFAEWVYDPESGNEVPVPDSTSQMSVKRLSEVIEKVHHFAATELGMEV